MAVYVARDGAQSASAGGPYGPVALDTYKIARSHNIPAPGFGAFDFTSALAAATSLVGVTSVLWSVSYFATGGAAPMPVTLQTLGATGDYTLLLDDVEVASGTLVASCSGGGSVNVDLYSFDMNLEDGGFKGLTRTETVHNARIKGSITFITNPTPAIRQLDYTLYLLRSFT